MKISMITPSRIDAGGFTRAFMLAKYLKRFGHETSVLCTSLSNRPMTKLIDGVTVTTIPVVTVFSARSLLKYVAQQPLHISLMTMKSILYNSDITHFFSVVAPSSGVSAIFHKLITSKIGAKTFIDWEDWWGHGGLLESPLPPLPLKFGATILEEKAPLIANGVTVVSHVLYQRAIACGIKHSKVFIVYNGADIEHIKPVPKHLARKKLELPLNKIIVGHIGYVDLSKIAKQIYKYNKDILFLVVGARHPLQKWAPVLPNILYVGRRQYGEIPFYLGACDILLLTTPNKITDAARFPIRLGDYLASGRPIVSGDVGEIGRIIKENKCGLVADPNDLDAWINNILQLADDAFLRDYMGRNARLSAENKYNWYNAAKVLEKAYLSI